ncbi:DUF4157 domain-containing protein [Streptomyces sp. NPDC020412]|uniref:DUF4157 domain-containing protein n=1 Tax=Streptomyces sp. NPDC020412 TaxID=3365073 RepID=UPI00378B85C0
MHDHKSARDKRTGAGRTPPRASSPAPPHALLKLQGAAGNAAVVQMLRAAGHSWVQEKHEHSAGCGHQESGEGAAAVQRSAVHDVLRTPGRPLDATTRTDMEARLGADFSDVRIHSDGAARASAAEIGARAYTSGNHVVIGDGGGDRHTLAHELTHVIQQRQGPVAGADNGSGLKVSDPADRFEREAEANAHRALSGQPPAVEAGAGPAPKSAPAAVQRLSKVQGSVLAKSGRAGWVNGVDKYMTLATGNARCHTISYEEICNSVIGPVNRYLQTGRTDQAGFLYGLVDAVFPHGATADSHAGTPNATALNNVASASHGQAITALTNINNLISTAGSTAAILQTHVDDLITALNSSPDNLREGNGSTNSSIGSALDVTQNGTVVLDKGTKIIDQPVDRGPRGGLTYTTQPLQQPMLVLRAIKLHNDQVWTLLTRTESTDGVVKIFSGGRILQSSNNVGQTSGKMSTNQPTALAIQNPSGAKEYLLFTTH